MRGAVLRWRCEEGDVIGVVGRVVGGIDARLCSVVSNLRDTNVLPVVLRCIEYYALCNEMLAWGHIEFG